MVTSINEILRRVRSVQIALRGVDAICTRIMISYPHSPAPGADRDLSDFSGDARLGPAVDARMPGGERVSESHVIVLTDARRGRRADMLAGNEQIPIAHLKDLGDKADILIEALTHFRAALPCSEEGAVAARGDPDTAAASSPNDGGNGAAACTAANQDDCVKSGPSSVVLDPSFQFGPETTIEKRARIAEQLLNEALQKIANLARQLGRPKNT